MRKRQPNSCKCWDISQCSERGFGPSSDTQCRIAWLPSSDPKPSDPENLITPRDRVELGLIGILIAVAFIAIGRFAGPALVWIAGLIN